MIGERHRAEAGIAPRASQHLLLLAIAGTLGGARTYLVLLTETYDGAWGIAGHANTNEELVGRARAQLAK
jgi:hypothetical protein